VPVARARAKSTSAAGPSELGLPPLEEGAASPRGRSRSRLLKGKKLKKVGSGSFSGPTAPPPPPQDAEPAPDAGDEDEGDEHADIPV
jgi:hypothetical protein